MRRTESQLTPFSAPLESSRLPEVHSQQSKELIMFTRHVIMQLKPNTTTTEFTDVVESKILPLLRKQKGFRDEITFIAPDRSEAIAISFWDTKEAAEVYKVSGYPEVLKTLTNLVEGTPRVGTAEVATSTFYKLAAAKTA